MISKISLPIHTERLIVRGYSQDDSIWYHKMSLRNKAHLEQYESENPVMSVSSEDDALQLMLDFANELEKGNHIFLGVFLKSTKEFVAQIYVGLAQEDPLEFNIGYFADVIHQGQGYVTEAVKAVAIWLFEGKQARTIRSECDDSNSQSIAVLRRCGFEVTEHLRDNKQWPDGTLTGTLRFALSR